MNSSTRGCSLRNCSKPSRSSTIVSTASSAVTVAARAAGATMANSPSISSGPSTRSITRSPRGLDTFRVTWPFTMRWSASPGSPSWKMTSPFLNLRRRMRILAARRASSSSSSNRPPPGTARIVTRGARRVRSCGEIANRSSSPAVSVPAVLADHGSPMDDLQLHNDFRLGDELAVRAVYDRYGGAMFAIAMSILGNRELAADCVQQAFVKAWRASQSFDPERELRPWLSTITRRVAIDTYRREQKSRAETRAEVDATVIPLAFERTWEAFEVRAALDELPDDEREVVRLSHFEGLAHPEIAEKLGVPVGT